MKKKETLDFLKGTTMDGIINDTNAANAKTDPVEKVATKIPAAPTPSVIPQLKSMLQKRQRLNKQRLK